MDIDEVKDELGRDTCVLVSLRERIWVLLYLVLNLSLGKNIHYNDMSILWSFLDDKKIGTLIFGHYPITRVERCSFELQRLILVGSRACVT